MTNNNQLIQISNTELTTRYSKTLEEKFQLLRTEKLKLANQNYPEPPFWVSGRAYDFRIQQRQQALAISPSEMGALAIETFKGEVSQIKSWANDTLKNIVDNQELALGQVKKVVTMKNLEIEKLITENNQLKASLTALEEKLRPFTTYLSENQQNPNFNASLFIQDNAGWTIEQLRERLAELQRLTTAYQANTILLESKVQQLTGKVNLFEKMEAKVKEALAKNQEIEDANIAKFNQTALENAQLKSQIIEKNQTIEQGIKYVESLESQLKNHEISLELKERNLQELTELNFQSKLKLQSLLFLDSMRSFLPNSFSNGLTTIETSIFVSSVSNHPTIERISWFVLFLLLISSILYTLYKLAKFTIFKGLDFFRWLRGKKTDLTSFKEKELEEWKDKWNVENNYSFTELEKAQKDKEVIEIGNNDQFNTSNLKVSKLSKEKKES